ncbi:hypothetical protein PCK1_002456 [Pneumocystis canis]|nr:hypothetical protein PCK1_002456 [Pneumocystis canis]
MNIIRAMQNFTNILSKSFLEILAASDDHEEVFADYLAVHVDLAILHPIKCLWDHQLDFWNTDALQRTKHGILSILLSLKRRPIIRYEKNSEMTRRLAEALQTGMEEEAPLFDFYSADTAPILLLLDRRNDPVTPLLTPWTYEAMVHELIGIVHGRVQVANFIHEKALQEIILSPTQDTFFMENMYLNFGDLGTRIKDYVEHYQTKTRSNVEIQNVSDIKRFVESYPEFRELSNNVNKHVTLMSELSTRVNKECLLDVSELEQSLVCNDSHATDLKTLRKLLQSSISNNRKIKLVLLYALRYEKHPNNALPSLLQLLAHIGVTPEEFSIVHTLLEYAGSNRRLDNLFESESFFSRAKSNFKESNDVENVYTQHKPRLLHLLMSLIKGRLREQTHPYMEENIAFKEKPQDIIVHMIGGITYAEARIVHEINLYAPGIRIVLIGDQIHNSESFLQCRVISISLMKMIFEGVWIRQLRQIKYLTLIMFSLNLKHTMKYSTAKFKHLSKLSGPFTSFNLSESIIPPPELTPNVQAAYLEPLRRPAKYGILTCSLQMRSFEIRRLSFFADFSWSWYESTYFSARNDGTRDKRKCRRVGKEMLAI